MSHDADHRDVQSPKLRYPGVFRASQHGSGFPKLRKERRREGKSLRDLSADFSALDIQKLGSGPDRPLPRYLPGEKIEEKIRQHENPSGSLKLLRLYLPEAEKLKECVDRHGLRAAFSEELLLIHLKECFPISLDMPLVPVGDRLLDELSPFIQKSEVHSPAVDPDGGDLRLMLHYGIPNRGKDSVPFPALPPILLHDPMLEPKDLLKVKALSLDPAEYSPNGGRSHIDRQHLFHLRTFPPSGPAPLPPPFSIRRKALFFIAIRDTHTESSVSLIPPSKLYAF